MTLKVDVTNCDREPIYIPDTSEPRCAMLVCEPSDGKVVRASANATTFLSGPYGALVGLSRSDAIGKVAAHDLRNEAANGNLVDRLGSALAAAWDRSPS